MKKNMIRSLIVDTINQYCMLARNERVLVGVSGGPDSVFLAHFLNREKERLGTRLYIAHLDHSIRGRESIADAEFVKRLAASLGLKFLHAKLKKKEIAAKSKLSLEERLREKRYAFFRKAAAENGCRTVATAHTLDDQAETVLMRIIKGASLKGVVGIHPVRFEKKVRFIRPLIGVEKKDILEYLRNYNIRFRVDLTNLSDDFLRNRIRNRVLPYLGRINPKIKRSLSNLAESLREDFEFIEEEKRRQKGIIKGRKPPCHIEIADLIRQPKPIRKEIARDALRSAGANIKKLTFRHWKEIDLFIREKAVNKSLDFPGGVRMRKTQRRLIFEK